MLEKNEALSSILLLRKRALKAFPDIWIFFFLYSIIAFIHFVTKISALYFLPVIMILHLLTFFLMIWYVRVYRMFRFYTLEVIDISRATHVYCISTHSSGMEEIVQIRSTSLSDSYPSFLFIFQNIHFIYNCNDQMFHELSYPDNLPLLHYFKSQGLRNSTSNSITKLLEKYGKNEFNIPQISFMELFKEHATAPFFVFQIFSVCLWFLDEYWYYSLFTLIMLCLFESTIVLKRRGHIKKIRDMRGSSYPVKVFRDDPTGTQKWITINSTELLPGDIVSITIPKSKKERLTHSFCSCDILLLSGSCVVNESLLTGESIPQLKEALSSTDKSSVTILNPDNDHKKNILFCGTQLVQITPMNESRADYVNLKDECYSNISSPQDSCLGYVLRTGFHTSQGKLLRSILFSTRRVTLNNKEALWFILILLFFAIIAALYVMYEGLKNEMRSRWHLLLNIVMIITSVVPPELPMELTLAVHTSLAALIKFGIFCTEPFRIPLAGAITHCCFDKTGTLTSDGFVVLGIAGLQDHSKSRISPQLETLITNNNDNLLLSVKDAPINTSIVLAACNSLILLDNQVTGDPLEISIFNSIGWKFYRNHPDVVISPNTKHKITMKQRYSFSSTLKRMSCIVQMELDSSKKTIIVSKGAPEIMFPLILPSSLPESYNNTHHYFSSHGYRVLTLCSRVLCCDSDDCNCGKIFTNQEIRQFNREMVEKDLIFRGFLVVSSPIKQHTHQVINELKHSNHNLVMITGDHTLTACQIASELLIADKPILILEECVEDKHVANTISNVDKAPGGLRERRKKETNKIHNLAKTRTYIDKLYIQQKEQEKVKLHTSVDKLQLHLRWISQHVPHEIYNVNLSNFNSSFAELSKKYDFCINGSMLQLLMTNLSHFSLLQTMNNTVVFSRVSPSQKEFIVRNIKLISSNNRVLFCGDGTNDMGGLKQAHCGIGLLSKHINSNKSLDNSNISSEFKTKKIKNTKLPSVYDHRKALKEAYNKQKIKGDFWEKLKFAIEASSSPLIEDDDGTSVKLGDASIASPFTSRVSDISSVLHVIRQGRCTLVTTIQIYKILALNSLITAYSLSVMYLNGVKLGDLQATVAGMVTAFLFLFISRAKPLPVLSSTRPYTSVFRFPVIASILLQFFIHLVVLIISYEMTIFIPVNLQSFFSTQYFSTIIARVVQNIDFFFLPIFCWIINSDHVNMNCDSFQDFPNTTLIDPDGDFTPNLTNSVIFLISSNMIIATFLVNYRGHPFMQSLTENIHFYYLILGSIVGFFSLTLGIFPEFAESLEIVKFPNEEFGLCLCVLMAIDLFGVWTADTILQKIYEIIWSKSRHKTKKI